MGWNSWNVFTKNIDENMLMEITDAMVNSGMRDVGYQYINIDDFWTPKNEDQDATLHGPERDAEGRINSNARFPDMPGLARAMRAKGARPRVALERLLGDLAQGAGVLTAEPFDPEA